MRYSRRARRILRVLARVGGFLIVLGALAPWTYLPVGEARFAVPGLLGWGALALAIGMAVIWRPAWWSATPGGLASFAIAWRARGILPSEVDRMLLGLQSHLDPLNALLAKFSISPIIAFGTVPWRELRGPGVTMVLIGSILCIACGLGLLSVAESDQALRTCRTCGYRPRAGRRIAFCVRCGAPMPLERACPACHTLAEPGDLCCAICGEDLG